MQIDAESKVNAIKIRDLITKSSSSERKTVIERREEIKSCKENLMELINKKENV